MYPYFILKSLCPIVQINKEPLILLLGYCNSAAVNICVTSFCLNICFLFLFFFFFLNICFQLFQILIQSETVWSYINVA